MDEEIEEQKNRNASLEKQIADGEEQLGKINVQGVSLKGELQEITEEQREFEFKLDHEIRQLTEFIDKKRRNISEIKHDVDMVHTLREDNDKMRYEMQKLQEQLEDINLDIYWIDHTFSHDLDRMVIFPLWKIEEDLERALDGEDPTLFDEPGPPEREDDEGDGYDYDDHDFDSYDEEASDEEETDEVGQQCTHVVKGHDRIVIFFSRGTMKQLLELFLNVALLPKQINASITLILTKQ